MNMRKLLPLVLVPLLLGSVGAPPTERAPAALLDDVRAQVIAHAPYKQWDMASGRPNATIGRTPGAACEAIAYLARDAAATGSAEARARAADLASWVIGLQQAGSGMPVPGGVPATPDLPGAASTYYYSIDAGFCGSAMLDMASATGEARYLASARGFGSFVLAMMRDATGQAMPAGATGRGPCEAVVQTTEGRPAWNCRRYVKSLALLPLLGRLDRTYPAAGYGIAARDLRATLMPGLKGLWEYADGPASSPRWHRIEGPHGEKDMFVFGDTVSYALRGLHEYEGVTDDLRATYADMARPRTRDARTTSYDPRAAYAGYVVADSRAADPYSRYYDIVTLGHLRGVRRAIAPDDMRIADDVLTRRIASSPRIGWKMDMDQRVSHVGMADISTLSSIGTALVDIQTDG
jgi:hypothetical protein